MDTVAVHEEHVRALLVEKGVEVDREGIIPLPAVAVGAVRSKDAGVGVVRVEPEVDVGAVVRQVHLRGLGGRRPVERPHLHELGDADRVAPEGIIEPAVNLGTDGGAWWSHRRSTGQHTGVGGRLER